MEKRKIKYIAIVVLLVAFCLRNHILKCIVGLTLDNYTSSRYSVGCTVDSIKSEGWNKKLIYAHDENGVKFVAQSNMLGMIKEESYANYYYAAEGNEEINEIVSRAYNNDFCVVKNLAHMKDLEYYLLGVNGVDSYGDYSESMREIEQYYWVYLKEKPSKNDVEDILQVLKDADLSDNIVVVINYAPKEIYDLNKELTAYMLHTESDLEAYCNDTGEISVSEIWLGLPYTIALYNYYNGSTEIFDNWE